MPCNRLIILFPCSLCLHLVYLPSMHFLFFISVYNSFFVALETFIHYKSFHKFLEILLTKCRNKTNDKSYTLMNAVDDDERSKAQFDETKTRKTFFKGPAASETSFYLVLLFSHFEKKKNFVKGNAHKT